MNFQKFTKFIIIECFLFLTSLFLTKGVITLENEQIQFNTTSIQDKISSPYVQDISSGLVVKIYPSNILNLTWNSTKNISVYIENKNDINIYCTLGLYQRYFITSSDGKWIYRVKMKEIYKENVNLDSVKVVLEGKTSNSHSTNINISTPKDCRVEEKCQRNICWYEKLCENDNSLTYILKLECGDSYYNGLAIEKIKAFPLSNTSKKKCIEKWNCSEWSECYPNNTQYRICIDLSNCNTTKNKPLEIKTCEYSPPNKTKENLTTFAVCGNGICEEGENQFNCCKDCGCPKEYECENNTCKRVKIFSENITKSQSLMRLFISLTSKFQEILKIFFNILISISTTFP